jgi:hypothetical protein
LPAKAGNPVFREGAEIRRGRGVLDPPFAGYDGGEHENASASLR